MGAWVTNIQTTQTSHSASLVQLEAYQKKVISKLSRIETKLGIPPAKDEE